MCVCLCLCVSLYLSVLVCARKYVFVYTLLVVRHQLLLCAAIRDDHMHATVHYFTLCWTKFLSISIFLSILNSLSTFVYLCVYCILSTWLSVLICTKSPSLRSLNLILGSHCINLGTVCMSKKDAASAMQGTVLLQQPHLCTTNVSVQLCHGVFTATASVYQQCKCATVL